MNFIFHFLLVFTCFLGISLFCYLKVELSYLKVTSLLHLAINFVSNKIDSANSFFVGIENHEVLIDTSMSNAKVVILIMIVGVTRSFKN